MNSRDISLAFKQENEIRVLSFHQLLNPIHGIGVGETPAIPQKNS